MALKVHDDFLADLVLKFILENRWAFFDGAEVKLDVFEVNSPVSQSATLILKLWKHIMACHEAELIGAVFLLALDGPVGRVAFQWIYVLLQLGVLMKRYKILLLILFNLSKIYWATFAEGTRIIADVDAHKFKLLHMHL